MWYSRHGCVCVPAEIHLARGHLEVAVDEVHQAVRQVAREIRPVIGRAVLAQAPRDVHARIFLARSA